MNRTWEELKKFWQVGEQWVESEASHLAVLVARALDFDRRAAATDVSAAPVADAPAPAAAPADPATPPEAA